MSGAESIPLIISALGTAASVAAEQQAQGERRDVLNQQFTKTQEAEDKNSQLVTEEGKKFAPEDREGALNTQQQQNYEQSQRDLGSAPTIIAGAGDAGNVSSDYLDAKSSKALTEGGRLSALARELAKTRSPGQLTTAEGLRRASLAGELGSMWASSRRGTQAAEAEAKTVETPWWGTAGKLASAGASAYGAGAGAANGTNYSLTGAELGETASQPSYWNTGGKVRFKG